MIYITACCTGLAKTARSSEVEAESARHSLHYGKYLQNIATFRASVRIMERLDRA